MMQKIKRFFCVLTALSLTLSLTGCWDKQELNNILLITGVGLDTAKEDENQINITLQIFEGGKSKDKSGGGGGSESSPLILSTDADNFVSALSEFSRKYYHRLVLQHNQVLLIGSDLAEKGVMDPLDVFARKQEARMEVSLMIVDGKAEEALSADLEEEKVTGVFLANTMNQLARKSIHYRVRMLDFISRLLDKSSAPVAPIIQVVNEENGQSIMLTGLAVFKQDKMVGRLSAKEVNGYIWAMGNANEVDFTVTEDQKKASFHISSLDCKRKITVDDQNQIHVDMNINTHINLVELNGFDNDLPMELIAQLTEMAQAEIQNRILTTFQKAVELNTDIYEIGVDIYRKNPKKWAQMKENWDEIFPNSACTVTVKATLKQTGQIVNSLEIEEKTSEN